MPISDEKFNSLITPVELQQPPFELSIVIERNAENEIVTDTLMDKEQIERLIEALRSNNTIQKLILKGQALGDHYCQPLLRALASNIALVELDLSENALEGQTLEVLCTLPMVYTSLKILKLSDAIGMRGLTALSDLLLMKKCVLEQLSLEKCGIDDNMVIALASILSQNPTLSKLSLAQNQIGFIGCASIAEILLHNTHLIDLDLSYNQFGEKGCSLLSRTLKELRSKDMFTLQSLRLTGNYGTTRLPEDRSLTFELYPIQIPRPSDGEFETSFQKATAWIGKKLYFTSTKVGELYKQYLKTYLLYVGLVQDPGPLLDKKNLLRNFSNRRFDYAKALHHMMNEEGEEWVMVCPEKHMSAPQLSMQSAEIVQSVHSEDIRHHPYPVRPALDAPERALSEAKEYLEAETVDFHQQEPSDVLYGDLLDENAILLAEFPSLEMNPTSADLKRAFKLATSKLEQLEREFSRSLELEEASLEPLPGLPSFSQYRMPIEQMPSSEPLLTPLETLGDGHKNSEHNLTTNCS